VCQSRVIGILGEQAFEESPSLELLGVGLIGRIRRCGQSQRVEDGRLGIFRVSRA